MLAVRIYCQARPWSLYMGCLADDRIAIRVIWYWRAFVLERKLSASRSALTDFTELFESESARLISENDQLILQVQNFSQLQALMQTRLALSHVDRFSQTDSTERTDQPSQCTIFPSSNADELAEQPLSYSSRIPRKYSIDATTGQIITTAQQHEQQSNGRSKALFNFHPLIAS